MKWFQGSISDAVSASKAKGAVFVVFIEGTDDASVSTAAAIADPDVSSKLESSEFVAIKLGSGTDEYTLFTEIYRIVPIPSLFFIGGDGRPIEIVAGSASAADILTRITTVQTKTKGATSTTTTNNNITSSGTRSTPNIAGGSRHQTPELAPPTVSCVDATATTTASAQEVLDKAKALMDKSRSIKGEEEKAKLREKEEERRRVGKEVQELRRWQQDQEMKQMKEEREREKREDLAARERVKQQIAFDKAERLKKSNEATGKKEPEKVAQNTTVPPTCRSTSDVARLQLRMPDGSIVTTQLPSTAPLSELRSFVSQHLNQPARDFLMSTTFPRRELLVSEDSVTMADLSLTPTAVVLVLPTSSGNVVRSTGSLFGSDSPVARLFWSVLTPMFTVFNYVRSLVFGGRPGAGNQPARGGGDAAIKRQQRQSPDNNRQEGIVRGGRPGSETTIRRQGNVHRLAQPQDSSDEENNTWNGNSTQQM